MGHRPAGRITPDASTVTTARAPDGSASGAAKALPSAGAIGWAGVSIEASKTTGSRSSTSASPSSGRTAANRLADPAAAGAPASIGSRTLGGDATLAGAYTSSGACVRRSGAPVVLKTANLRVPSVA
jgi:hypothetical protein